MDSGNSTQKRVFRNEKLDIQQGTWKYLAAQYYFFFQNKSE